MTKRMLLGRMVILALVAGAVAGSAEAQQLYVGPGPVLYRVWTPRVYWWNSGSYLSVGPYIHGYVAPPGVVIRPPGYLPYPPGSVPLTPRLAPPPFPYGYRPQPYAWGTPNPMYRVRGPAPYYPPRPIPPYYGSQSTHPRPRPSQSTGEQEKSKAPPPQPPDPNDETRTPE